ncbi:MAG: hypothetical protein N4A46_09865 [Schleiferiaceae bacterium]|jgi:hypothetical protein|nr:hypothetical protein [Schleiferiaceae bacterium]
MNKYWIVFMSVVFLSCSKDKTISDEEIIFDVFPELAGQLELAQLNVKYPTDQGDPIQFDSAITEYHRKIEKISKINSLTQIGVHDSLVPLAWHESFEDILNKDKHAFILEQLKKEDKKAEFIDIQEHSPISDYELISFKEREAMRFYFYDIDDRFVGGALWFSRIYFNETKDLGIFRTDYYTPESAYGLLVEIELQNETWQIVNNQVIWNPY